MYSRKIHFLNSSFFKGEELSVEQTTELNAALAPEEQFELGYLAQQLSNCKNLSEMLRCADISMEEFSMMSCIDDEMINRWHMQPLTTFEQDMIVYLLCRCAYEEERTHYCQMCQSPFYGYYEKDCLCDDCLSKLLLLIDGRGNSLKE